MNLDHLDLLNKSLLKAHSDLQAHADKCGDIREKLFSHGRVAGFEIAVALLEAWRKEVRLAEADEPKQMDSIQ